VTGYRVRERLPGWTLLELDLITGRTHQIRVHLDAIGHPLAGDPVYGTGTSRRGPDGLERLFLHSWRIELDSPDDGHVIRAVAPLPPELESALDALRRRGPGSTGGTPGMGGSGESGESGDASESAEFTPPVQKRPA
jgi:hypothetical protein